MRPRIADAPPSDSDHVQRPQKRCSCSPKAIHDVHRPQSDVLAGLKSEGVQRPQKRWSSSSKRSVMMRRFHKTFSPGNPNRYMVLRLDPENTLRQHHDSVAGAATPGAPAVPLNSAVAKSKVVFSAIIPSTFVCSDPVKRLAGDPKLERRPLS